MKNVFVIHSYNGDTIESFAPGIEQLCGENNIPYYFPIFPIRENATYESWEQVLNEYKDILNKDSIVIAHSLGTLFFPRYVAKNNIEINTYVSVAGFLSYTGREDLERITKKMVPQETEMKTSTRLINNIYSIYSDNDEMNSVQNLEQYANKLKANKILIKGAGHFNPKSKIKDIQELREIVLGKI